MSKDKSIRSLCSLSRASSNRVLNLIAIADANSGNPRHKAAPLFESKALNNSIIVKHRLRADEVDLFEQRRVTATKIIIPFEKTDLRMGGKSLFVGQRGFEDLLFEVGNYQEMADMKRDRDVAQLIDAVPSLDPFLLREQLRCADIMADSCYFAISASDQQAMHNYATREISRLTALANGKGGASASKMVGVLLSTEVNERLEPLRQTLSLNSDEFSEGVFSWRGFIYYKWCLAEYWPQLIRALRDIKAIRPARRPTAEDHLLIEESKQQILLGARSNSQAIRSTIAAYDNAYGALIDRQDPKLFRGFLLGAPQLFLDIGERMGAMSHITNFWNYRFPPGAPKMVEPEELISIFQDFTKGLAGDTVQLAA